MTITATRFRKDIYKLFDRILRSGEPIKVTRKGKTFLVVPERKPSRLANLKKHPGYIKCDPEELVHMDWSKEWKPFI